MIHERQPAPTSGWGRARARGFTLIELLVVILIVLLVSAVALPTVISGIRQRQVSEAARIFQAAIAGVRDAAISNNAPRGIRLLPDPVLTVPLVGAANAGETTWACNRFIPIEPAPDYREGRVMFYPGRAIDATYNDSNPYTPLNLLLVLQSFVDNKGVPVELTSWAWNLRVGDKIQFESRESGNQSIGSGHVYTIVGPVVEANPENYINYGPSGPAAPANLATPAAPEFLLLVNGVDDDGDGFVDNGYNGVATPLPHQNPFETEKWMGAQAEAAPYFPVTNPYPLVLRYVAKRRPIPARGAQETLLPANVVIDLTTWNSTQERSRLPMEGTARFIDVLLDPGGQVIQSTSFSSPTSYISPFLHFWLTDREGVVAPRTTGAIRLPMPEGTSGFTPTSNVGYLQGERMLLTMFTRTGNVTVNSLQTFTNPITNVADINVPFFAAQLGVREEP